jgi:hypothetical protein
MQLNGSFIRTLVSNIPDLLSSGSTENLAIGQIGIFDGETYQATTAPVYHRNKSIIIAQGTPGPVAYVKMSGLPGQRSEKSENIKGNLIRNFKSFRGKPGQSELVAIGYDGVDTTKTIAAIKGDYEYLYIKLTGQPVSKIASPNGLVLRYSVFAGIDACCGANCTDCAPADSNALTDYLVNQINSDSSHYGLIRAYKKLSCTTPPAAETTVAYTEWQLQANDLGDATALGRVQAQYPGKTVTAYSRDAAQALSTYHLIDATANGAPAAFTTSTTTLVPDCPTCPSGYTSQAAQHLLELTVPSGATVTSAQITGLTVKQLLSEEDGRQNYLISVAVAQSVASILTQIEAVAGWDGAYIRDSQVVCTLTTPTTVAWTSFQTGTKTQRTFTITLADSVCGTNRLAELQAAYAGIGTVSLGTGSGCVHTYTMPLLSQFIGSACYTDKPDIIDPPGYMGAQWVEALPPTGTGCSFGIWIESAYVNRITGECTYGFYPYEADGVHIQLSNYDPNYNSPPVMVPDGQSGGSWPVTPLRVFMQPQGFGAQVRVLEERSKDFVLRSFSMDPAVREAEGFKLFADPMQYYDQYGLWFTKRVGVGGFSTVYEDQHIINVHYPAGLGTQFANAIGGYVTSIPGIQASASAVDKTGS